jgi:hypothetical protein
MQLVGASSGAALAGANRLPGTVNYLIGRDPAKWLTGIPTFSQVHYTSVYPGINLVYYGSRGRLEFDFRLSPGADARAIQFRFKGGGSLGLNRNGDLVVKTGNGPISFRKPSIYQLAGGGGRRWVKGSFRISADNIIRFAVGPYDHTKPLIIDPILNYSTYFGNGSAAQAIAVDPTGEAYVTGWADTGMPTTTGSLQPTKPIPLQGGTTYPYIAKFNRTGTALLYCTYLSGSGSDESLGIALDGTGDAFVVGTTSSKDFPITSGAFQTANKASSETGFVTELNNTGTALLYSTYLGGSASTKIVGIATDALGDAYLAGITSDADFPTTTGAFQTTAIPNSAAKSYSSFVSKLNPTGTSLIYSSYLAGNGNDWASAVAVDSAGAAYVGGNTASTNFPTTAGAFQTTYPTKPGGASFVTKMKPDGSGITYSTFLSGCVINAVAVDASDNAYTTGIAPVTDFPVTPGAFQTTERTSNGFVGANSFVTKLNPTGSALVYSTYLGGSYDCCGGVSVDTGDAIAVDSQGDAIVAGRTTGLDFPTTPGALQNQNLSQYYSGNEGGYLTKIDSTGSSLLYSTYINGSGDQSSMTCDCAKGVALDAAENVYVAGVTVSVDFPTTLGAFTTPFTSDEYQSFITEFNANEMTTLPPTTVVVSSKPSPVEFGQPVTFTATVQQTSGSTPAGTVGFSFYGQEISDGGAGSGVGMGPWQTVPLNKAGVATYTTSSFTEIKVPVIAHYLGDGNNAPSNGTMTQNLTQIPTTTTLTSSENPAAYDTPVTFTTTSLDNTGKPVGGIVLFAVGNTSYAQVDVDRSGHATWVNGTGGPPLPPGQDTVKAELFPGAGYQQTSGTLTETFTPLGVTPSPTFSPPAGNYSSAQSVTLNEANNSASIYYATDGSTPVPTTSYPYLPGMMIPVDASETIQAIAVAPGYTASNVVSAKYVIALPPPSFTIGGTPVAVLAGAATGNTSTITITPSEGFTGTVTLTAAIASGPSNAQHPPTFSFGATSAIAITGSAPTTAVLTVSTTPAGSSALDRSKRPVVSGYAGVSTLLACCLFFGMRKRRYKSLAILGFVIVLTAISMAMVGCGSSRSSGGSGGETTSGTTPGTYTVIVSAASGAITKTCSVILTVN